MAVVWTDVHSFEAARSFPRRTPSVHDRASTPFSRGPRSPGTRTALARDHMPSALWCRARVAVAQVTAATVGRQMRALLKPDRSAPEGCSRRGRLGRTGGPPDAFGACAGNAAPRPLRPKPANSLEPIRPIFLAPQFGRCHSTSFAPPPRPSDPSPWCSRTTGLAW